MITTNTVEVEAVRFKELLTSGLNNIAKACEIYVEFIDKKPEDIWEFRKLCPEIPPRAGPAQR